MLMATDWPAVGADLPADLIKSGVPISGLYELAPLRRTSINDDVRMDAAEARRNSPIDLSPVTTAPIAAVVGGAESAEFQRQTRAFAEAWRSRGVTVEEIVAPGCNHFTVLDLLAEAGSPVHAASLCLLGL